jgi:type I restriction enzyme S subunit
MSLPRYPEYKDSGVAWLGEVPGHWVSAGLRWLSIRYSGGTPDKTNLDYWTDGTIPWLNSGEVNQSLVTEPSTYITEEAFQNSSAKWIPQGALVMALAGQGKTKGMVAQLGIPATCNQSMAAIIPTQELDARFLFWWLTSNYQNIRNMAGGDLRDGLNLELLGSIPCPLAPLPEQQTIAAFLDRETSKIDALIAEQQHLVALLAEKRQVVISHAVTKGLNPSAPMKDSGIEWLGEVPEHWVQTPIKHTLNGIVDTEHKTAPFFEDGDYLVVRTTNIKNGKLILDGAKYTDRTGFLEWTRRGVPTPGDIMFTREAPAGEACLVPMGIDLCIGQRTVVMKVNHAVLNSRFALWSLYGGIAAKFISDLSQGSTVAHFNMSDISNIPIMLTTLEEQQAIATFLDTETAKFDTLTLETNRAIALLQERRAALISAAVTGKIDVRGKT